MRRVVTIVGTLAALGALASGALAADLPEIRKRGKLLGATSGNLLPVSYVNEKNELVGYDIEVAHYMEKKLGLPIDIAKLDFKGIMPGLQTGRFDAVFSNVNITAERKLIFDYSIPYSRSAIVAVVRTGVTGVNSYKDLKGKNVGGISGGADGELPAREIEKQYGEFK
ncbi:MAG: transporter substrate-binding domain-containing protein, partial [Alphaproteobacteria bacterium]|nr:transporter substrate-binding domain-containing protein [Alphaproteobacteria bacterium]